MIEIKYFGTFCSINQKYVSKNFVLSDKYRQSKWELGYCAKLAMQGKPMFTGDIYMGIDFTYTREPDIDAFLKFFLDSLQDVVYSNDKQIKRLMVEKKKDKKQFAIIRIDDL